MTLALQNAHPVRFRFDRARIGLALGSLAVCGALFYASGMVGSAVRLLAATAAAACLLPACLLPAWRCGSSLRSVPRVVWAFSAFWIWMVGTDVFNELTTGRYYETVFARTGWRSGFFVGEQWGLWGVLWAWSILVLVRGDRRARALLLGLLFVVSVWGLAEAWTSYLGHRRWERTQPLEVFGRHYNLSAKTMNGFVPFALAGIFGARTRVLRGLAVVLLYAGTTAVYLTHSRGGIVALVAGLALFSVAFAWGVRRWRPVVALLLILVGAVAVLGLLPSRAQRATEFRFQTDQRLHNLSNRTDRVWPDALGLIAERPIRGHTTGTYRIKSARPPYSNRHINAHNTVLQVLYNGGVVGLVLFLVFVWCFFRDVVTQLRAARPPDLFVLAAATSFVMTVLVHGVVEATPYWWMAVGLGWYVAVRSEPCPAEARPGDARPAVPLRGWPPGLTRNRS